jgi:hypothetical protein
MIRRQPVPDIRRQQEPLLTITTNEVLRHPGIAPLGPDGTPLRDSLRGKEKTARSRSQPGSRARPSESLPEAIPALGHPLERRVAGEGVFHRRFRQGPPQPLLDLILRRPREP